MEDRLGPLSEFHSLRFRTKWVGRFAVPNFRLALQVEERRWEDDGGPIERVEGSEGGLDRNVDLEYGMVGS